MKSTKPRPSLLLFAFGLSVIVATLRAAQTGFFHEEDFGWTVFAFCLSFGVTLVGGWGFFSLPVEWAVMKTDVQYQATEKAKLIHQAETLGAAPVAGNGAGVVVEHQNPLQAAWVVYWIDAIRYSQEVGGLTYRQMADYFKNGKQWETDMITPLIFAGYVTPRSATNPNAATTWAGEWDADKVVWRLEAGVGIPPLPPYSPQAKFQKQDTPNTGHNTVNTRETEITR